MQKVFLIFIFSVAHPGLAADVRGLFWGATSAAIQLEGVAAQLRDPRKVVDEPWTVADIEYRLLVDGVRVTVTEGRVAVRDPLREDTPTIAMNTAMSDYFAVSFIACREDGHSVVGLHIQPRRAPREPDRGMAAVYFSVRATNMMLAGTTMKRLLAASSFHVDSSQEARPIDNKITLFLEEEMKRVVSLGQEPPRQRAIKQ